MNKAYFKKLCFILPALTFVFVFTIIPIIITLIMSFTSYNGYNGSADFVGFENYLNAFQDPNFIVACINTIVWILTSLILPIILPLLIAIGIMHSRWKNFFKFIFYAPNIMAGVAVSMIMAAFLGASGLPSLFGALGFENLAFPWLSIPYVNTIIMILANTWQAIGLNLILFLIAFNSLDMEPIEAAMIDGASKFKIYLKIIFPAISNTFVIAVLMSIINNLKVFDQIWIMTDGGPYRTSETLAVMMYNETFIHNNYGEGAAIAVLIGIISVIVAVIFLKYTHREA